MDAKNKNNSLKIVLVSIITVASFAVALLGSLLLIGADSGEVKGLRNSPTGLVSAGAPRSQLSLKQMFDSMGAVRTNGNRVVYEPITEEYLRAVSDRIERGEKPTLSVEEILYIISDSVASAEKYDGVKLHGEGTVTFKRDDGERMPHLTHLENSRAIYEIIVYRIKSLCHGGAFEEDGNSLIYYPDPAEERGHERKFVFTPVSDAKRNDNIVFYPGNGQTVTLYPTSDGERGELRYMLQSDEPIGDAARIILENYGYSPDRCRNITPSYWKGITECKLVVVGGRILIVDPICGRVTDSAPEGMRTVSVAAGDNDGDGVYELYFTAYSEVEGVAVRYSSGNAEILIRDGACLGAYEDLDGRGVSFYRVEQIESGSHLNLLRRSGDKLLF